MIQQLNSGKLYLGMDINPADILTRGVHDPADLMKPNKNGMSWLHSAAFLSKDESEWPQLDGGILSNDDPEIKAKSILVSLNLLFQASHDDTEQIDAARFSSWKKLKRVAAWVLRFIANYVMKKNLTGDFSCAELGKAEHFIIWGVQHTAFQEEIELLESGQSIPRGNPLSPLCPFLDDGLSACRWSSSKDTSTNGCEASANLTEKSPGHKSSTTNTP